MNELTVSWIMTNGHIGKMTVRGALSDAETFLNKRIAEELQRHPVVRAVIIQGFRSWIYFVNKVNGTLELKQAI